MRTRALCVELYRVAEGEWPLETDRLDSEVHLPQHIACYERLCK